MGKLLTHPVDLEWPLRLHARRSDETEMRGALIFAVSLASPFIAAFQAGRSLR